MSNIIKVNKDTDNPEKAWVKLKNKIPKIELEAVPLDSTYDINKFIRVVCISDTHNRTKNWSYLNSLPNADILIHAGDFTNIGSPNEINEFNNFLGNINNIKYKVVIAGNHELSFHKSSSNTILNNFKKLKDFETTGSSLNVRDLLTNCIYLEDSSVNLLGINIYGSPWQPWFGGWAFNAQRGQEILNIWNKIPSNTDILITHGPPLGFGDRVKGGYHVGCCELLSTVIHRVKPKYHIFGHIHEDYGQWTNNETVFVNASINDEKYRPLKPPIVFDFPKNCINITE